MGFDPVLAQMGYVPQGARPKTIIDNGEPGYHQTTGLENLSRALDKFKNTQEQEQQKKMVELQNKATLYKTLRENGYSSTAATKAVEQNTGNLPDEMPGLTMQEKRLNQTNKTGALDYNLKRQELVQKSKANKIELKIKQLELEKQMGDKADPEKMFTHAATLRKEYDDLSKSFNTVRDSYNRIIVSAKDPSPAGDLSLIFNYMKILDPGSVVRESEFATAENAAGVPEQIRRNYNKVLSGEKLGPDQRKDFVSKSGDLYKSQLKIQNDIKKRFENIANESQVDPYLLFGGQSPDVGGVGGQEIQSFNSEQEAEQAGLPAGTIIMINGRRARID